MQAQHPLPTALLPGAHRATFAQHRQEPVAKSITSVQGLGPFEHVIIECTTPEISQLLQLSCLYSLLSTVWPEFSSQRHVHTHAAPTFLATAQAFVAGS